MCAHVDANASKSKKHNSSVQHYAGTCVGTCVCIYKFCADDADQMPVIICLSSVVTNLVNFIQIKYQPAVFYMCRSSESTCSIQNQYNIFNIDTNNNHGSVYFFVVPTNLIQQGNLSKALPNLNPAYLRLATTTYHPDPQSYSLLSTIPAPTPRS